MLRKIMAALTVTALLLFLSPQAEAGKYGSGRSSSGFSSRSSSSFGGRSSSFGSRSTYSSSQPKYSSGPKQSSSPPKYSSGSKPSPPKYSGGSSTPKPSGSKYGSGTPDSGGSKYGSKGKGFATGSNPSSSSPSTGPPAGKSSSRLDPAGQMAQQKFDSKNSYKPQAPKTEWKDPKTGTTRSFTKQEQAQVQTVRKTVTHERYITYEHRYNDFYGPYMGRPVVYYSDPFGPFFYLWLFDRCTAEERARWAYNHRSEMDDARYRDMVKRDADLEARVRALEAEKKARDPNYVPAGMSDNPDLMYNKDFVNAAYNPSGGSYERPPEVSPEKWRSMSEQEQRQYWIDHHKSGPSAGTVLLWLLIIVLVGAAVVFVIWFVFVRET